MSERQQPLYFDHNATTPLRPELREPYLELLAQGLGNPSSLHAAGRLARAVVDEARERAAAALGVDEDELVFTSGGTEADNLALLGAAADGGGPVAVSPIEHAAVLEAVAALAPRGIHRADLSVDPIGTVTPEAVEEAVRTSGAQGVSVGWANGEVGVVQDVARCVESARRAGARWFHTDAVQALGRVPMELAESGVDLAALSAHKLGGPIGVGLLFVRRGTELRPLTHGGGQEQGLRPGTENAAAIAIAAQAIELAVEERVDNVARQRALLDEMFDALRRRVSELALNGPSLSVELRLPNTLNLTLPNVDGRVLVTRLDLLGLQVSSGSACASGSAEPSHVLLALGLEREAARRSIRLSIGPGTRSEHCRQAVDILATVCAGEHASRDGAGTL